MKTKFYGSSDDLVEIEGDIPMLNGMDKGSGKAEWNVPFVDRTQVEFHIVGTAEKCSECGTPKKPKCIAIVRAFYNQGIWSFSLCIKREGARIPESWSVKTTSEHDYSMALEIDTGAEPVWILVPWYKGEDE